MEKFNKEGTGWICFASYSYAFEELNGTVGINRIDYPLSKPGTEVFVELTGREEYLGVSPSGFYAVDINGSRQYGEFRVSKDYIVENARLSPYLVIGVGNYYT